MHSRKSLTQYFRNNPDAVPVIGQNTRVFYFGINRTQPNTHNGVITAYWEMNEQDGVLVGFSFCDPRDTYDRMEARRGLMRLRTYGAVRGDGHRMKIRNSKLVVHVQKSSGDPLVDVTNAFKELKTRTTTDPRTGRVRTVVPVQFENWNVSTRTYTNKKNEQVTVPTLVRATM